MSTNYATVRQLDTLRQRVLEMDKQHVELTNQWKAEEAKLAEIRAVCDKVQAFCEMVNKLYLANTTPAERARSRAKFSLQKLI